MAVVCPTITEYDLHSYRRRMEEIESFADHVHIDLMDGEFAPTKSPDLAQIWWPDELVADVHLMYQRPAAALDLLIKLKPRIVIIPFEAESDHRNLTAQLHAAGILAGLALLRETPAAAAKHLMRNFDHVLVFSGNPGRHQGVADLTLLDKAKEVKSWYPDMEIGWDGGVNDQNAKQLVSAGVDVLNVGGFIAGADDPAAAYAKLKEVIS